MLRSKSICYKISFFFHSYFLFSKLCFICKRHKVNMNWYTKQRYKSPYINIDVHVFQMKTVDIESVANRQSRRCYASIPMDEDRNINARIVQRRWYCAGIPMDEFRNMNVLMVQRRRRCAFDSPGLASDSEVYPGSFAVSSNNAVGVVPFIPQCFIAAFHTENVQHLRRWPPHYMHNPG